MFDGRAALRLLIGLLVALAFFLVGFRFRRCWARSFYLSLYPRAGGREAAKGIIDRLTSD